MIAAAELQKKRERLRELLLACSQTGTVTLSSGKIADFYIDGRQVTLNPEGLDLIATLALEMLAGRCDAVGGPTSGADPIVAGIGLRARDAGVPLRMFFTRSASKQHGLQRRIEGPPLHAKDRVALIDDVVTSGGSILRAARAVVEDTEAEPRVALVVVDREEGAREALSAAGIELLAIFRRSDLTTSPSNGGD